MDPFLSSSTSGQTVQPTSYMGGGSPSVLNLVPISSPTTSSIKPVVTSSVASQNLSDITTNKDKLLGAVQTQSSANATKAQLQAAGVQTQAQYDQLYKDGQAANKAAQDKIDANTKAIKEATTVLSNPYGVGANGQPLANPNDPNAQTSVDNTPVTQDSIGNWYNSKGQSVPAPGTPKSTLTTSSTDTITNADGTPATVGGLQTQKDTNLANYTDQVNQIFQGVFPLSASQQALVDSLKQSLTIAENAQKLANANYEGGMNIANVTSGRSRYAPEIAKGIVFNAVSAGIAKIQELDNLAAQHLAELQQGFQTNNLDMITKAYNATVSNLDAKTQAINKMQEVATAAAKDARDFAFKQTQTELENVFNFEKFDYQKSQDVIDNSFKAQQIDLDQKKFLETKLNNQRDYNLKLREFNNKIEQQTGGGSGSLQIAAQEYASTGKMPSWITKEDAAVVAILAKSVPQPAGKLVDAITGLPNNNVPSTQQTSIIALNDALKNLDTMEKAFGEFHQGLFGALGNLNPSDARQLYNNIKGEFIAKLLQARSGAAITPQEYDRYVDKLPGDWNSTLGLGSSGAQKIRDLKTSLEGALNSNLTLNGLRVTDAKVVEQDATTRIQNYRATSPENNAKAEQIINDNPNLSAEEIMQILP